MSPPYHASLTQAAPSTQLRGGASMTDKVLCRYYLHGACKFGEGCRFSHDLATAEQSQVGGSANGCALIP